MPFPGMNGKASFQPHNNFPQQLFQKSVNKKIYENRGLF